MHFSQNWVEIFYVEFGKMQILIKMNSIFYILQFLFKDTFSTLLLKICANALEWFEKLNLNYSMNMGDINLTCSTIFFTKVKLNLEKNFIKPQKALLQIQTKSVKYF